MEFFNNAVGNAPDLDRELVDQTNYPRQFVQNSKEYPVGTTYETLCGGLGAKSITAARSKVSGGTVTSVIVQGYVGTEHAGSGSGDNLGWYNLITVTDDAAPQALALGQVGLVADQPTYQKFRIQIIIAVSAVVLDWTVIVH